MSADRGRRPVSLLGEMGVLTVSLSAVIVLVAQLVAMRVITGSMTADLRADSLRTAAELQAILEEPLFVLDDEQARRIGETLLSTGRISGIELESTATGPILMAGSPDPGSTIPSISGSIAREGLELGEYRLHFSDAEVVKLRKEILQVTAALVAAMVAASTLAIKLVVLDRVKKAFVPIFDGFRKIAGGDYAVRVPAGRYVDTNNLIALANLMTAEIQAKSEALQAANQNLEAKVADRTLELERSLEELRLAQDRLVDSGKLSALGQLAAGIAHELNTPLGAILSSNRLLLDFFDRRFMELARFLAGLPAAGLGFFTELGDAASGTGGLPDMSVSDRRRRLAAREALEAAGIGRADELAELLVELGLQDGWERFRPWLDDPGAAEILRRAAPAVIARRMAGIIELAGEKASGVVSALRSYLAPDGAEGGTAVDLEAGLEKVLTLMHNMLKHGVEVTRDYAGVEAPGSADKLDQVWLNLLRNAAEAMDYSGRIGISTALADGRARVTISHSGPGVPEALRERIFEPFFTTKKAGEGMGLGLDICRRIVERHGGSLRLECEPGRTAFIVELPGGTRKGRS